MCLVLHFEFLIFADAERFLADAHGGAYPAGGGFGGGSDEEEFRRAHQEANNLAGGSGNSNMFSNILGNISQKQGQFSNEGIDEQRELMLSLSFHSASLSSLPLACYVC